MEIKVRLFYSIPIGILLSLSILPVLAAENNPQALERSCNQNEMHACVNLGILYRHGDGVTQDDERAFKRYQRACYGGLKQACGYVGDMFFRGLGTTQDKTKGERMLSDGCLAGNQWACAALKRYKLN